jgi:uncharacterized protein
MTPPAPPAPRDARIDALRGFALGGILLVNIQSFTWGADNPAGTLPLDARAVDRIVFYLTVMLANGKFMPLFALLFGVGFAILYNRLRALTPDPAGVYRRRMAFLFVFGLLHGALLYFGDITHMYAVAGLVLLNYVDRSVGSLKGSVLRWWTASALWTLALVWLLADLVPVPDELAAEVQRNHDMLVNTGYWEQLPVRLVLFIDVVFGNLFALPQTVALMMTGLLAWRAGWLLDMRATAWRWAMLLGATVGLPAALVYGGLLLNEVDTFGRGAYSVVAALPAFAGMTLAFAYAALVLRYAPTAMVRWLAPAGRMPLTNYLMQSLLMGVALSGWGLGLGAQLEYTELAALALMLYALQLVASRVWLQRWNQGPVEALWRRWTYARLPSAADSTVRN